jgi:GT2 family glycosyltransferase
MKTAVVILNWNGLEYLRKFLPALTKHTTDPDTRLVVADNGSTDGSLAFLDEEYSQITTINLGQNYGFAGGYNRALSEVKAEYYLLLNSDIEVTERWLTPLVEFLDTHPGYAGVAPVLLDYFRKDTYEYAGAAGGFIDRYGYTFCRGRIFDRLEARQSDDMEPVDVFWTTGACMLIRAELFRQAGGFDDHFFAHMEEVDLCWRLKNMGYKFAVTGASAVYHVGGGTLPKKNPKKTYLNFRNNLLLLYKNLPVRIYQHRIATRLLLDYLSVIRFIMKLGLKDAAAVFRAHRSYFRDIRTTYAGKTGSLSESNNPGHPELYNRSVVIDYFLLGNRTFDRLRDMQLNRVENEDVT